ncbi:hypothetical protein Tco_1196841, partial [Tanacetum coccineum]
YKRICVFYTYQTFCFDLEENSSGSTTTRFDYSLPDYEAFYSNEDHIKEKSSGSTTTHADFSQYDSFIFDHSICFMNPAELGDFTMDVVEDIYPTREPRVHVPNVLPTHPTLHMNMDLILSSEPLFTYIVWIFLPFLTYPVAPPYLLSCGNEDTILTSASPFIIFLCQDCPDFEASRAHSFVLRSQELQNPQLHFGNSDIQILSTNVYL